MDIILTILNSLPEHPIPIRKVIIGVHWTLVCSKYCGLGSTLVSEGPHGHMPVRDVGCLHQKSAQELAYWIQSDNLTEASIGIAAINSLLEIDDNRLTQVNAADIIARMSQGKNLAIIGHFPFVDRMKQIAKKCWVIEKRPHGEDYPEKSHEYLIPQADVVAITGTAIINHTIEGILSLCRPDAIVLVLGPSTPLLPKLFDFGISFLSGSRVIDEDAAVNTIQQGAIFPQVNGVRLVTMSR